MPNRSANARGGSLFPLFVDLNDAPCLIVGGGTVATRKARHLLKAGARVTVIAPELNEALSELVERGDVEHQCRNYREDDVHRYKLVVAATGDRQLNAEVAHAANQRNIPVNVADPGRLSTAVIPSMIQRGALKVAQGIEMARAGAAQTPRETEKSGVASTHFDDNEKSALYRIMQARRDMRHFLPHPVDPAVFARLLEAAHLAPSVGLMQPWRFVRITDRALRRDMHALVDAERTATAQALGERQEEFMRLKVEGILECGELLVAALMDGRERHVFGRRTLPEMDLASVACAIQNLWLAARAEGLGMGWVSMFDPQALARLLEMPPGAKPVAILSLGHVPHFYPAPMLELEGWTRGRPLHELVFNNTWGNREAAS